MKIWLDDERTEPEGWVRTYNIEDTITCILNGATHISLDNDLGALTLRTGEEGYQVMQWLEEKVYTDDTFIPPVVYIHTANPEARRKMEAALASIARQMERRKTM